MSFPIQSAVQNNPFTGVFGNGQIEMFINSGTFTVPLNVTRVRVRMWGAGYLGGGGFTLKTIDLGSEESVAVTVGITQGATSSFGNYCSATGGTVNTGGSGIGGDINTEGGTGGTSGAGAGNLFGNGGHQNSAGTSGGGATAATSWGGAGFTGQGGFTNTSNSNYQVPASTTLITSIDYLGTGGGGGSSSDGWNGGGGGVSGNGGFPAGGGPSGFGKGLLIVEY